METLTRLVATFSIWGLSFPTALSLEVVNGRSFAPVSPIERSFPRDHGAHPNSAVEWWYLTGHLFDESGQKKFGTQFTIFRISAPGNGLDGHGSTDQVVVHVGLTDLTQKVFSHSSYTLPITLGQLRVSSNDLDLRGPGFHLNRTTKNQMELAWKVSLKDLGPVQLKATLTPQTELILHGQNGLSKKGQCPTCATIYSSWPRLRGDTKLTIQNTTRTYTGQFWYDHEFGSNVLEKNQIGWDWFGITLDDGRFLMAFQLRDKEHKAVFKAATIGRSGGRSEQLDTTLLDFSPLNHWQSPRSKARYPIAWSVTHPAFGTLEIVVDIPNQEVIAQQPGFPNYYEGTCHVLQNGERVGHAYLEMNGYGDRDDTPQF